MTRKNDDSRMKEERIAQLLSDMWDLKGNLEMESTFAKYAKENDAMRELWSEYVLLVGEQGD